MQNGVSLDGRLSLKSKAILWVQLGVLSELNNIMHRPTSPEVVNECLTYLHRWSNFKGWYEPEQSESPSRGLPMRKWPGVSTFMPSLGSGKVASGQELRRASIWVRTVMSSSKFNFASPTIIPQVGFHTFDGCFPQPTELRHMFRNEFLADSLTGTKLRDGLLCHLILQKL